MDSPDNLLSYKEAADYLTVSVSLLRRWVKEGKVKSLRLGPQIIRFTKADLDQYIEACHVEAEEPIALERACQTDKKRPT